VTWTLDVRSLASISQLLAGAEDGEEELDITLDGTLAEKLQRLEPKEIPSIYENYCKSPNA
jgi:hypothetical protein